MNVTVDVCDLREFFDNCPKTPQYIYLDLYVKRVSLAVYSEEFFEHIYNQIPYIISKDNSEKYDATVVLWKENDPEAPDIINEYDEETQTYYYGVKNLEYEEFIKQGHFLVQILYRILKTDHSSLVHGAVVGAGNTGVLLCARGQRGKSTLTVLSMLNGMEYVSDDYLFLEQAESGEVFASPIYSIITLSPEMSSRLKDKLAGTKVLGLNARKDKFVYNIENCHGSFRKHYPIRVLVYPEIVDSDKPFIREATATEKGRAVVHLIHSTVTQMNDMGDATVSKRLIDMVNQFDCYYMGLSKDIEANSKLLSDFMTEKANSK